MANRLQPSSGGTVDRRARAEQLREGVAAVRSACRPRRVIRSYVRAAVASDFFVRLFESLAPAVERDRLARIGERLEIAERLLCVLDEHCFVLPEELASAFQLVECGRLHALILAPSRIERQGF